MDVVEDRGWEVLRLSSAKMQVEVIPALGGTVTSVRPAGGRELLWRAPWGLAHAASRPVHPEAVAAASFPGGWQTLIPGVSDSTALHGVELSPDSEARTARFDWRSSGDSVILTTRLLRTPIEVTKTISVRGAEVTLGETVRNVGRDSRSLTWTSQVVFGAPLVGSRTVVEIPAAIVHPDPRVALEAAYDDLLPWPRCYGTDGMVNLRVLPAAGESQTRLGYVSELSLAQARVMSPDSGLVVEMEWDATTWPHVWYSLETGRRSGFPWFGTSGFLALSPSSSWPARPVSEVRRISGTAVVLDPGASRTSYLTLRVTSSKAA